jgi:DNA-binding transcriptional LysR family regulator
MQINLSSRTLHAFLTLVECRQFNHAADRCNISQSAFSQLITRLEDQLGVRLFERSTRSVSLTPEGELLVPVARRMLDDIASITADLSAHAKGLRGKAAFAAVPTLADNWLPRVIADFQERFPGMWVQFFDVTTQPSLELVRRGSAEFALNVRAAESEELEVQHLFSKRFFLVCPPDHRLASRKRIAMKDLAGCSYINSNKHGAIWPYLSPFMDGVPLVDTGLEVGHFSTLAGLIANGLGVSVVPEFSVPQFRYRGLTAIAISDKNLTCPVLMVKRRGHRLSEAAQTMLNLIEASAKDMFGSRTS